jgi:uncharacterized protein (DUF58 family)
MHSLTLRDRFRPARFTRGLGPEHGPVTLGRTRIFILPTAAGLMFAAVLLVMLFGSINYSSNLGYMFTFLLGSMALVSIFHTYRNLAGLHLAPGRVAPVFAGGRAAFEILVGNPQRAPRYGILLSVPGQPPARVDLAGGASAGVVLYRAAERRGRLALGRWTIASRAPLGLFRAWARLELHMECLVYPHPGPPRPVPQAAAYSPSHTGDKGRGVDDFAGLRPWRPGDSPRHLFWKAAARDQPLLVKQFGGDRADELWLQWQDLPELDTEARLSQLCRWVLDAARNGRHYGLRLPGLELDVAGGGAHRERCLRALARFRPPQADA